MPNFLGSVVKAEKPRTVLDAVEAGVGLLLVIGHLGRDPEFRTAGNNKEIAKFSVAVSWGKRGEPDQHTEWINCIAWEEKAALLRTFTKGDAIMLIGKPGSREYKEKMYGELTVYEVARPLIPNRDASSPNKPPQEQTKRTHDVPDDEIPF